MSNPDIGVSALYGFEAGLRHAAALCDDRASDLLHGASPAEREERGLEFRAYEAGRCAATIRAQFSDTPPPPSAGAQP